MTGRGRDQLENQSGVTTWALQPQETGHRQGQAAPTGWVLGEWE